MIKFLLRLAAGILGLWLAVQFVPGVEVKVIPDSDFFGFPISRIWQIYIIIGIIIGLVNFFIKPILNLITLPLRILTLGLFGIVINMGLIWLISVLFSELVVTGIFALLWLTLIIWALDLFLPNLAATPTP